MKRDAWISTCGRYRYTLWRIWDASRPFVCLNPSTADANKDDPTLRRVMAFAQAWGYGGVLMLNQYAYRATNPADMKRALDPIGEFNDLLTPQAGLVVAAWGKPCHPLYLPANLAPVPF